MGFYVPNGQSIAVPVLNPSSALYDRFPATTPNTRARILVYHGLNGGGGNPYSSAQVSTNFITNANADGYEVVSCADPADVIPWIPTDQGGASWANALVTPDMRDDPLHGGRFVQTVLATARNMIARIEADHGWMPLIVMGGSWGAWTTCQLVVGLPNPNGKPWVAFMPFLPPVVLGPNVVGFGTGIFPFSTSGADLGTLSTPAAPTTGTWTSTFLNGVRVPGYLAMAAQDTAAFPMGASIMAQNAKAAGCPLAGRTITDARIVGGTTLTSQKFGNGYSGENGTAFVYGAVNGTISGITGDTPGVGTISGTAYSMTLSTACTNTPTVAVTSIAAGTGSQWVITTSTPHGMTTANLLCLTGFTATGGFGGGNYFNVSNQPILAVTSNTITVDTGLTYASGFGAGTTVTLGVAFLGQTVSFPGIPPSYMSGHTNLPEQFYTDAYNWLHATISVPGNYPMVY